MPVLSQCDIFKRIYDNDVAIVFGHIGFNNMAKSGVNSKRKIEYLEIFEIHFLKFRTNRMRFLMASLFGLFPKWIITGWGMKT